MRQLATIAVLLAVVSGSACGADESHADSDADTSADAGLESQITVLETLDVSPFNVDLVDSEPTAEVAFYVTEEGPLEWEQLAPSIERAKRIFATAGVQLRVSSALLISVPQNWQQLDPDESDVPTTPGFLKTDLYAHLNELRTRLTARNRAVLEAIVSYHPSQTNGVSAANTIHAITLDEVPISYYEWSGTEWIRSEAPTGGLSFPPYLHADRISRDIRGVITLSTRPNSWRPETRALAHEIGHKLLNVSHEGVGVCPSFEANGDDLMLYGDGERIAQGAEGRWHRERLLLSPFLYRLEDGTAEFANTFQNGGIYRDGLYGDYIVDPPCAENTNQ